MSDVSDYRTLVKSKHYIDLPGESPKSKLWPGVNNLIILRKHRDVVFDVKLGTGATYTVTTDRPQSEYGRFYDPKRNLNVIKVTFKDGEPCHLWVGRTFEGCLILKQGEKELGRYPIRKMDCTQGCTEDPKDKPAPMLIIMHDDKALAKVLLAIEKESGITWQPVSPLLAGTLSRAMNHRPGPQHGPFPSLQTAPAPVSSSPLAIDQIEALPTLHAFSVKQMVGPNVPEDILEFFASGADAYKIDPLQTLSRNFIVAQIAAVGGYFADAFAKGGPMSGFWRRAFILQRSAAGEYTLLFSTSTKERRIVGYLLGVYQTGSTDVRVMTIAGGAGSMSASARAAWSAAGGAVSVKTMTGRSMYFAIAMDSAAWMHDYFYGLGGGKPKKDWADLFAAVGMDIVQMWLTTVAASAIVSGLLTAAAFFLGVASAPIWAIAIGTVAVTLLVGYFVAAPFNVNRVNAHLANLVREAGRWLEKELPRDYGDAYSQSDWVMVPAGTTQ